MSLRDALKTAVARCTPLEMQHATLTGNSATADETGMQPNPANPHEIRLSCATAYATPMQQGGATDATGGDSGGKLQVAFTGMCNTQLGALTAHRITADLLKAAMRVCDHHGDSEAARQEMSDQCIALPLPLQRDLLAHFKQKASAFSHEMEAKQCK